MLRTHGPWAQPQVLSWFPVWQQRSLRFLRGTGSPGQWAQLGSSVQYARSAIDNLYKFNAYSIHIVRWRLHVQFSSCASSTSVSDGHCCCGLQRSHAAGATYHHQRRVGGVVGGQRGSWVRSSVTCHRSAWFLACTDLDIASLRFLAQSPNGQPQVLNIRSS